MGIVSVPWVTLLITTMVENKIKVFMKDWVFTWIYRLVQHYLDTIKHKLNVRKCFGMVFLNPPVKSTLSLFWNLSEIATKMFDTFTSKGAEKQKAREWIVNEILWLSKALWNDQVANNSKRDSIKCLEATALVTIINSEESRYE